MSKRILSIVLILLIGLSVFPVPVAAAASVSVDATYVAGTVTVTGSGFTSGDSYTVRVVNTVKSEITAMAQVVAGGSGEISASITTGVLGTLSDYAVYVNNRDGSLAARDNTVIKEDGGDTKVYKVTYNGNGHTSGSVPVDNGSYTENETVTVLGNVNGLAKAGYEFTGWTINPDGTGTVYRSGEILTMGAADITLYAKWTARSSSDPNNNGDKNNSEEKGDKTTVDTTGGTTTAKVTVTGITDPTTGKVTATLTNEAAANLINSAKAAENEGKKAIVEIIVKSTSQTQAAEVTIPRDIFDRLAGETDARIKVNTDIGSITFDADVTENISGSTVTGDISIGIQKVDISALDEETRKMVGERPVYDFSVLAGGRPISSFGGESAEISIPYILQPGEDANAIVVYYIDDSSGKIQTVRGAYNPETGTVGFKTTHFSKFAVAYNKVNFTDVSTNAWYHKAVTFIAARGITTGTGENRFSPDAALTRGQFIVMLMRAYGMEPEEKPADNFADAGNTYYTNYLAAAKRLKISSGVGNNNFAPDSEITRQDMFTLLYRALDLLGELPAENTGNLLSNYSDEGEISDYAADAMENFVESGIVSGNGRKLEPNGKSNRAQMAQVLYNLLSK